MSGWFKDNEESRRLVAQERLIVEAAELVSEAADRRGASRAELSRRIGVKAAEVSQRLGGRRNLTLRSLADMLHVLDFDVELRLRDRRVERSVWHASRCVDWPSPSMRYTSTGTPLRLVDGSETPAA